MKFHFLTFACLVVLLVTTNSFAEGYPANAIVGLWEVEDTTGKIEIYPCGDRFCGRIAWIKEPLYPLEDPGGMAGKPLLDRENPKKELRNRPQLGLQIMEGYTYRSANLWEHGTIYNTENGNTYRSKLSLKSPDRLELRAFIGISLFGGSTIWKRVSTR
jgi:uncharacterized protein (DUF2147 family)